MKILKTSLLSIPVFVFLMFHTGSIFSFDKCIEEAIKRDYIHVSNGNEMLDIYGKIYKQAVKTEFNFLKRNWIIVNLEQDLQEPAECYLAQITTAIEKPSWYPSSRIAMLNFRIYSVRGMATIYYKEEKGPTSSNKNYTIPALAIFAVLLANRFGPSLFNYFAETTTSWFNSLKNILQSGFQKIGLSPTDKH